MLSISEKIYCEGNNNNISYLSYTGSLTEYTNPSTAKTVLYFSYTGIFKINLPIKIGAKYKVIINYTKVGLIAPNFTGFTHNYKYFTATSSIFSFEISSVGDKFYLDSIELIELTSTIVDTEENIEFNKFSGVFTDIEHLTGEYSFNFNIILNSKSDFIRYPNDNRVSYIGVLNGKSGAVIINSKDDNYIDVIFVEEISNLIQALQNTTLKQCAIASEMFSIETSKDSDLNCLYNYIDSDNFSQNLGFLLSGGLVKVLDYNLTIQHLKPAVKLISLFDSIFEKIGYAYDTDLFSLPFVQNLGVANYQYYKDIEIAEYSATLTGSTSMSAISLDQQLASSIIPSLTDAGGGGFVSNFFTTAKNATNEFKFKSKITLTTETAESSSFEYPYNFSISFNLTVKFYDLSRGLLFASESKNVKLVKYETKDVEFDIETSINTIASGQIFARIEIEVQNTDISGSDATFDSNFDYDNIVDITVDGDWSMNENENIKPAKDYEIRQILPEMSAYEFVKSIINLFALQIEFKNNTLTLYTFDDYFIRQSTLLDFTNRAILKEKTMPSAYLSKNYKYNYLEDNTQNKTYFDKINNFISNNCENETNIEIPFNLPTNKNNNCFEVLDHLITPFNNLEWRNPYTTQKEIKGNFLILQDKKSLNLDVEHENGSISQMSTIPLGSNNFRNFTASFTSVWTEYKTGIAELFLNTKLNEFKNANSYKQNIEILLTQLDYEKIKKNTLINIDGQKYLIDKLSNFNPNKLTKMELIKTALNENFTGVFLYEQHYDIVFTPQGAYVTDTFSGSTYSSGSISQTAETICASSSVCKLKVTINNGFEYSTDEVTWVAIPVGTEITLANNVVNQYYLRLNGVAEGTYRLKLEATIADVLIDSSLFTYFLHSTTGSSNDDLVMANINTGEQKIINAIISNEL